MKKWGIAIVIILILAIGGFAMFPTKLPETKAFQDEYTRKFMDSPKEVEPGYYLYKSKTDGYTMLFPKDATLSNMFYTREKDYFEHILYENTDEEKNIKFETTALYDASPTANLVKQSLATLSQRFKYTGNFQKLTYNGNTIYYAKKEVQIEPNITVYRFFSNVKSNDNDQAIEFVYSVSCSNKKKECAIDVEEEESKALSLMKSIKFKK